MSKILVRQGTKEDRETLIEFEMGLQNTEAGFNPVIKNFSHEEAGRYVDDIFRQIDEKSGLCLIAAVKEKPIGFTVGWIERDDEIEAIQRQPEYRSHGYIAEGYVAPKYRGQRVYSLLVERLEQYFRDRGVSWVRRETLAQNKPLQASAERHGYALFKITYAKKLTL